MATKECNKRFLTNVNIPVIEHDSIQLVVNLMPPVLYWNNGNLSHVGSSHTFLKTKLHRELIKIVSELLPTNKGAITVRFVTLHR